MPYSTEREPIPDPQYIQDAFNTLRSVEQQVHEWIEDEFSKLRKMLIEQYKGTFDPVERIVDEKLNALKREARIQVNETIRDEALALARTKLADKNSKVLDAEKRVNKAARLAIERSLRLANDQLEELAAAKLVTQAAHGGGDLEKKARPGIEEKTFIYVDMLQKIRNNYFIIKTGEVQKALIYTKSRKQFQRDLHINCLYMEIPILEIRNRQTGKSTRKLAIKRNPDQFSVAGRLIAKITDSLASDRSKK